MVTKREKWDMLRAGASDVLVGEKFEDVLDQVCDRLTRWNEIDEIVSSPFIRSTLVGNSHSWRAVLKKVVEAARYSVAPVLLTGESGTGKELLAHAIHELDNRRGKKDLITVDCTNLSPDLAGSELFGHERGAFTGALGERDGAFALANGGTLFLDEVGELSLPLQAQLLRSVQERKYRRVGGNTWRPSEFRLVCATNRDLVAEVDRGRFRADLYFRIASWLIHSPPLRERRGDIPSLAQSFLERECGDPAPPFDDVVLDHLMHRDYPGNIRELRQLVLRIGHRHVGLGPITVGDIPESDWPADLTDGNWRGELFENTIRWALACGAGLKEITQTAADTAIRLALEEDVGNLQRAARRLQVTDRALQMRRANRRPANRPPDSPPKAASQ